MSDKKRVGVQVVLDSITKQKERIATLLLTFPRYILAQLNTHRMFSKNSASSRAIPSKKMLGYVSGDMFRPIAYQKAHKGMQGTEYFNYNEIGSIENVWDSAGDCMLEKSKELMERGVTKQISNRLLEPFMWHTVLLTATDFENFFAQRCPQYTWEYETGKIVERSKKDFIKSFLKRYPTNGKTDLKDFGLVDENLNPNDSLGWLEINKGHGEIHIMALAEAMWDALNESKPQELADGEWHIPFGDNIKLEGLHDKIKVATARCARTSYMNFEGGDDYEKDIALHDDLLVSEPMHASPSEHCARAMTEDERDSFTVTQPRVLDGKIVKHFVDTKYGVCKNFTGFIQYRWFIENNISI